MTLLIDGYNLIYASGTWAEMMDEGDIERARHNMISHISQYLGTGKRRTIVVFDGRTGHYKGPDRTDFTYGSIKVLFTGREMKADDKIVEIVKEAVHPREITVVTSDRSIQRQVRALGAAVKESGDFRSEVFKKVKDMEQRSREKGENGYPLISYEEYMEMLERHEKNS
ncbi:NYN domain-containing protein [Planctomycetota bacterium]